MWRPAILLCLLAALTGTPLRQAEAADDWLRSLQAASFEAPDGGVGDDSEVGTLTSVHTGIPVDASTDSFSSAPLMAPPPLGTVTAGSKSAARCCFGAGVPLRSSCGSVGTEGPLRDSLRRDGSAIAGVPRRVSRWSMVLPSASVNTVREMTR